ncbi:hypothetical protein M153_2129000677 [Pseudoloma neurophilia]|uniref:Uncharacterized protein n=1 Tax=Pseudoloma neurophilia TaxID=146866 RepID=A0A0R0LU09_9MICR|nr:hypothetical protein M153_2129000677 [Pseudoloma neurophilia]
MVRFSAEEEFMKSCYPASSPGGGISCLQMVCGKFVLLGDPYAFFFGVRPENPRPPRERSKRDKFIRSIFVCHAERGFTPGKQVNRLIFQPFFYLSNYQYFLSKQKFSQKNKFFFPRFDHINRSEFNSSSFVDELRHRRCSP